MLGGDGMRGEMTTVMISKEVRDTLRKQGFKDETYDSILRRLLTIAKKELFLARQRRILETQEFVPLEEV